MAETTCIQWDLARQVMARSTVFTTNRSQAVRLLKTVAFPEDVHHVEIVKLGRARLITPAGTGTIFFSRGQPSPRT
jgi:virulence-associated protein VagC